jgi:hypothetical protein
MQVVQLWKFRDGLVARMEIYADRDDASSCPSGGLRPGRGQGNSSDGMRRVFRHGLPQGNKSGSMRRASLADQFLSAFVRTTTARRARSSSTTTELKP